MGCVSGRERDCVRGRERDCDVYFSVCSVTSGSWWWKVAHLFARHVGSGCYTLTWGLKCQPSVSEVNWLIQGSYSKTFYPVWPVNNSCGELPH